ncbi:hypothetical protein Acsp06_20260 [Actinomycetospora sp. NBRC 106375]|uniref:DUF3293 domain-containing protein n=1 Tax=Actinomycetospora sp. NBRC 106375 TaxID=3032207 RepID=UPI0024A3BE62|nr:DUF3293 domain-containing protein [Actinomycetospora sp. NBRC 106375]GLZ45841.1 hypothetical protein Acsp06_20260 [Actinomycetospora sp. NBRC 106375]
MSRADRTDAYARAVLRVPDLGLVLRPRPAGEVVGTFPFTAPVHVVTAHNPGAERPGARENAVRQARLEAALDERGLRHRRTIAGAGDGSHAEEGALVVGLDDDDARALGAAWGQDAVFRWSPTAWTVLACDEGPSVELGWALSA